MSGRLRCWSIAALLLFSPFAICSTQPVLGWDLPLVLMEQPSGTKSESPQAARPASGLLVAQGEDVRKDRLENEPGEPVVRESLPFQPDTPVETPQEPNEIQQPAGGHFRASFLEGNRPGQEQSFGAVGLFYPWMLDDGLLFLDGQFTIDNLSNAGTNLGGGRRWYFPEADAIFGLHAFFDLNTTGSGNTFYQVGSGADWSNDLWKLAADVYVPVGNNTRRAAPDMVTGLGFTGNNLVQQTQQQFDVAMTGVELSLSRRLGDENLWLGGGWYHYKGGGEKTDGATGSVSGWLTDNVLLQVGVSDDPLFGSNLFGMVTLFSGLDGGVEPQSVFQRMRLPVGRRSRMAVTRRTVQRDDVLTQGGVPITVTHINDAGVGIGTGTADQPLGSLSDAAGATTDVIYLHADSLFIGQQYAAAPGQRILGESDGVLHLVQTDQLGHVVMPRATAGMAAPVVQNSAVAFTLDSGVELANVTILNPTVGVAANNIVGDVDLQNVTIQNPTAQGVLLSTLSGTARLQQVSVSGGTAGIAVADATGLVVDGGMLMNNGVGIQVDDVNLLAIQNVEIQGSLAESLLLAVSGSNVMNATVTDAVMTGAAAPAAFQFGANVGAILNLNLFNNESSAGFALQRDANGFLRLGGPNGIGGFFNDDNNNVLLNGNTSGGGPPTVFILGSGNQIEIIDPVTVPTP